MIEPATGSAVGMADGGVPARTLAVIGESTAAGLGAPSHDLALGGSLARELSRRHGHAVSWRAIGHDGATARQARSGLLPQLPARAHDILVLVLGVNDVLSLTTTRTWEGELRTMLAEARERTASASMVLTGVPPLHHFPALPQPLAGFLGLRAHLLDAIARETAADTGVVYVPTPEGIAGEHLCADGIHPSPTGYALWAQAVADSLAPSP